MTRNEQKARNVAHALAYDIDLFGGSKAPNRRDLVAAVDIANAERYSARAPGAHPEGHGCPALGSPRVSLKPRGKHNGAKDGAVTEGARKFSQKKTKHKRAIDWNRVTLAILFAFILAIAYGFVIVVGKAKALEAHQLIRSN